MTKHSISKQLSRLGTHRAGMMASVAILALLGAGLATQSFMTSAPANAAASTQSATVATFPSFADVVSRVRPAVVSVKVKVEQVAAGAEDGEQFQMPDLPRATRSKNSSGSSASKARRVGNRTSSACRRGRVFSSRPMAML